MSESVNKLAFRSRPAKATNCAEFVQDHRGFAAVEFGLIALPFLLLIVAILEYSYGNFAQSRLDAVIQQTAREIMTGYVQNQQVGGMPLTAAQFRATILCPKLPAIMSCNDLYVDVQDFDAPAGGAAPATTPYANYVNADKSGLKPPALDNAQNAYCIGGAKKYVVIRAVYPTPILTTAALFPNYTTYKGRKTRLVTSTATFKNEPFPSSYAGC
ncbi:TadE/TadG family type IV pilus assembly protein [Methylocystis sp. JAN1]|uniref:TadE/TadG family type IV pilus assembly protein n=1 Tax=Methylocystis sp. JAN1 TaxID=3397211 RepID=UPI003FA2A67F